MARVCRRLKKIIFVCNTYLLERNKKFLDEEINSHFIALPFRQLLFNCLVLYVNRELR